MAKRPVFVPLASGKSLVAEVPVEFRWHSGMAASQKKKNVESLHAEAELRGIYPILEVSSKSDWEAGRRLSAFSLKSSVNSKTTTLECVFQGSKVFELGGPFEDLYWMDSRDAKRDPRLTQSGKLVKFSLEGVDYPLWPATAFYDWIYIRSIYEHREWLKKLFTCQGFTDIEFNPDRSVNCQARAVATFIALLRRDELDRSYRSFESFRDILAVGSI